MTLLSTMTRRLKMLVSGLATDIGMVTILKKQTTSPIWRPGCQISTRKSAKQNITLGRKKSERRSLNKPARERRSQGRTGAGGPGRRGRRGGAAAGGGAPGGGRGL